MTATNHALTGALIGLVIGQPLIALPVAFLSHFVCDAIPHYGNDAVKLWSDNFKKLLVVDASVCVVLVAVLTYRHPAHWLLASFCAFMATSPDLLWIRKFVYGLHNHRSQKQSRLERLLGSDGIQWFQRPIGAVVEVAWAIGMLVLISPLLAINS
jgi:hypothetical protein